MFVVRFFPPPLSLRLEDVLLGLLSGQVRNRCISQAYYSGLHAKLQDVNKLISQGIKLAVSEFNDAAVAGDCQER